MTDVAGSFGTEDYTEYLELAHHRRSELSRRVRQSHDLTAGWVLAGDSEIVCRNDLAPNDAIYRPSSTGWSPYAFIDCDLAGPARRVQDVAHRCWQ
jgi:hypothetical protein